MPYISNKDVCEFIKQHRTRIFSIMGYDGVGKSLLRDHLVVGGGVYTIINRGALKSHIRDLITTNKSNKDKGKRDTCNSSFKDEEIIDEKMLVDYISLLKKDSGVTLIKYSIDTTSPKHRPRYPVIPSLFELCVLYLSSSTTFPTTKGISSINKTSVVEYRDKAETRLAWVNGYLNFTNLLPVSPDITYRFYLNLISDIQMKEFAATSYRIGRSITDSSGTAGISRLRPSKPIRPVFKNSAPTSDSKGTNRTHNPKKIPFLMQDIVLDNLVKETSLSEWSEYKYDKKKLPLVDPFLVVDGILLVVDCLQGITIFTKELLIRAVISRVKVVLFINKLDKLLEDTNEDDSEIVYNTLLYIVNQANDVLRSIPHLFHNTNIEKEEWLLAYMGIDDSDKINEYEIASLSRQYQDFVDTCLFIPEKGNVLFGSALQGWCFSLPSIAQIYFKKFCKVSSPETFTRCLWGDNYFDSESMKWSKYPEDPTSPRAFTRFIVSPLQRLRAAALAGKEKPLRRMLKAIHVCLPSDDEYLFEKAAEGGFSARNTLFKAVMNAWMPVASILVETISTFIPPPLLSILYRGPSLSYLSDPTTITNTPIYSHKSYDNNSPILYIFKWCKGDPSLGDERENDPNRYYAFARILRGGEAVRTGTCLTAVTSHILPQLSATCVQQSSMYALSSYMDGGNIRPELTTIDVSSILERESCFFDISIPFSFRVPKLVRICGGVTDDIEDDTCPSAGIVAITGLDPAIIKSLQGVFLVQSSSNNGNSCAISEYTTKWLHIVRRCVSKGIYGPSAEDLLEYWCSGDGDPQHVELQKDKNTRRREDTEPNEIVMCEETLLETFYTQSNERASCWDTSTNT